MMSFHTTSNWHSATPRLRSQATPRIYMVTGINGHIRRFPRRHVLNGGKETGENCGCSSAGAAATRKIPEIAVYPGEIFSELGRSHCTEAFSAGVMENPVNESRIQFCPGNLKIKQSRRARPQTAVSTASPSGFQTHFVGTAKRYSRRELSAAKRLLTVAGLRHAANLRGSVCGPTALSNNWRSLTGSTDKRGAMCRYCRRQPSRGLPRKGGLSVSTISKRNVQRELHSQADAACILVAAHNVKFGCRIRFSESITQPSGPVDVQYDDAGHGSLHRRTSTDEGARL